jgi:hypothetical protein
MSVSIASINCRTAALPPHEI